MPQASTVDPVENRPAKGTAAAASERSVSDGVDVKELLKAGVHFGHKSSHWNPKMEPYIHSERGGIYIIDLLRTATDLTRALEFAEKLVGEGKQVLFVGTKRHIKAAVKAAAQEAKMPYVAERWFGGTLTNFATIRKRTQYLKDLEQKLESGELEQSHSKRELGKIKAEMAKLNHTLGGLKEMDELPGAIFVTDVLNDRIAIKEAVKLNIPVIAAVDTNADPSNIEYVIAANDDALSSITLLSQLLTAAINRGHIQKAKVTKSEEAEAAKTAKAAKATEAAAAKTDAKLKAAQ